MELLAHRGESYIAPENTLAAINLAWEKGATAVEIDIYETRDRKIVLCHDTTTGRTAGTDLVIKDTDAAELRKLDFGRIKGEQYTGEKIPFFDDVLATTPKGGKILCEVKCGPEILPLVNDALNASGKRSQIVIISFNLQVVSESKKLMPDVPAYWLQMMKRDAEGKWLPYNNDELIKTALEHKLDGLDLHYAMVTKDLVDAAKQAGLAMWTWTVNDPAEAKHQADLGVDGMATDRWEWMSEQLK